MNHNNYHYSNNTNNNISDHYGRFIMRGRNKVPLNAASPFEIFHEPIHKPIHQKKQWNPPNQSLKPYNYTRKKHYNDSKSSHYAHHSHIVRQENEEMFYNQHQVEWEHYEKNKYDQINEDSKFAQQLQKEEESWRYQRDTHCEWRFDEEIESNNYYENNNYDGHEEKKDINDIIEHCDDSGVIKANISNIIGHDFKKCKNKQEIITINEEFYVEQQNEDYYQGYLYHIELGQDINNNGCSMGMLLPEQIPDSELHHIQFPVQIETRIEEQLRENIKYYTENDLEQNVTINTTQKMVKINLISLSDRFIEHRLKINAFQKIIGFNKFIFKLLNDKHKSLKEVDDKHKQQRFYLLVPLKSNYDGSSFDIDFESIKRICKGSKQIYIRSDLKNELVQIHTKLFISYGVYKDAYINHNNENKDDVNDAESIHSFANESIINCWNAMNVQNNIDKEQKQVILTRKADRNIKNVLNVYNKIQSGEKLRSQLGFHSLDSVYPTGITSTMWYTLKNLPAILWRIENWLNIIHLKQKLIENEDDMDIGDIDTTLLFQAMHRAPISTNNSYQILNNLGSHILKALITLYAFSTDPTAKVHTIRHYVENRTNKIYEDDKHNECDYTDETYKVLIKVAKKWNIVSFAMLKSFKFTKWNPPGFKYRGKDSLYHINLSSSSISDGHGTNRYLGSYLIQSIIGVCWYSFMNKSNVDQTNLFSCSIKYTLKWLWNLGIVSEPFYIANKFKELKNNDLDLNVKKLKEVAISNKLKFNPILCASLMTVCRKTSINEHQGITMERLAILGDSILDLLVIWHICRSIGYHIFIPQIGDRRNGKWKEFITNERHFWVNNENLAASVIKSLLHKYITRYTKTQKIAVTQFAEDVAKEFKDKRQKMKYETATGLQYQTATGDWKENKNEEIKNDDGSVITDITDSSLLQEICRDNISPIGDIKNRNTELGKKCLGTTFEGLLGAIFLGSNCNIYSNPLELKNKHFNLIPSIEFLISFLGNHTNWKKTMRPYIDKYFDIIIAKNEFNKSGYVPYYDQQTAQIINLRNTSKYYLNIHLCPNCKGKNTLVFNASYKEEDKYKVDWKTNAMELAALFNHFNDNDQSEIKQKLSIFATQQEFVDNVHEYQCKKCKQYIGHNVKIYREYCTKKLSERTFSSKQIVIAPFKPRPIDEAKQNKPPKTEECNQCQDRMQLLQHSENKDSMFWEKKHIQYCNECELYRIYSQIYKI